MDRRDFIKTAGLAGSALALSGATGALPSDAGAAQGIRPNIILIMVDDMGYSDLGCFGSEIETPNIDRLAAGGIKFTQFYNCSRCCPTRASLLTVLYPHQAGIGHMTGPDFDYRGDGYNGRLNDGCVTIPEVLRETGYRTYMSGKWHLGEREGELPVDRGFEDYFGILKGVEHYFRPRKLLRNREQIEPWEGFYTTDAFTDHAIERIRENHNEGNKPYFLYLAYNAPHYPLQAKPEDIEKYKKRYIDGWDRLRAERYGKMVETGIIDGKWALSERDREVPSWDKVPRVLRERMAQKMAVYAAMVDSVDQNIGRLLEAVKLTGQMGNTLILFLSDNGACSERGPWGFNNHVIQGGFDKKDGPLGSAKSFASYGRSWSNASNTPFRLHKHWTHEGGIATPLIAHWPSVIKNPGAVDRRRGHVIDIMSTCLGVAGASYPTSRRGIEITPMEGKSIAPAFEDKPRDEHEIIAWEHEGNRALRRGKWKIVSKHPHKWELYDLEADRTELNNLAKIERPRVEKMAGAYKEWARRCGVKRWNPVNNYLPWVKEAVRDIVENGF